MCRESTEEWWRNGKMFEGESFYLFFVHWFVCIKLPTASTPPIGSFQFVWLKLGNHCDILPYQSGNRFLYIRYMSRIERVTGSCWHTGKFSRCSNLRMCVKLRPNNHVAASKLEELLSVFDLRWKRPLHPCTFCNMIYIYIHSPRRTNISLQKAMLKIKFLFQLVRYVMLFPLVHEKMRFRPQKISGRLIPANFCTCFFMLWRGLCVDRHAIYTYIYIYGQMI